ncbi:OTU-domain-containing protein [Pluteus cervinus]|uniref:OTU-domain-containing protein n=1 Tax=Pluteus cervinus TaxID=181527 RepID=A0ACD3BFA0_9AGAR|nr:OTU-domain-containing protein [Pluteus cervinus]
MAPLRLRHPNGTSTIQVALDSDDFTVGDLQQEIYGITQILPSQQILKSGYPPQSLTLIPELPISSLGLKNGEQIIVSQDTSAARRAETRASASTRALPATRSELLSLLSGSTGTGAVASTTQSSSTAGVNGPDFVETDTGFLIHRVVPDDNSCLFSAVSLVFEQGIEKAQQMRQIVAEGIKKDPETYNEAILGMTPSKYIETITKPSTWGGAIELQILANHYRTEIASIDVETGRVDHFSPPGDSSTNRCILIYSGIHYDAATLAPTVDAPNDWHESIFTVRGEDKVDPVIKAATKLGGLLRQKKAFTNTSTFDLKCEQCGKGLKGEKEARAHAAATGHVKFGEY